MSKSLLKLDAVSYSYGRDSWHLDDVSLEIRPNRILGIIGPNGAGKSTLLKIAAGTVAPTKGKVWLTGKDLKRMARRETAKILGYLPQNVDSSFDYTVEEVAAMGRFAHLGRMGFLQAADLKLIEKCLIETETIEFRRRTLSHLSGGEKQRVLLASVLAQEPKILLLDEPTTGLDLHHQASFFTLLAQQAQRGIAVATVTHDLNLAALFCDELLLMQAGKIVIQGAVEQVMKKEILCQVYHENIYVGKHPETNKPIALPTRKLRRN